jgi:hypothetical protein
VSIVPGGVRKSGARVRINAQLVEAETGAHLWAEKFDGALNDIFDLQDQITDRVVAVVEPSVQKSEMARTRRKRPDSLDAYDLFLRAVRDGGVDRTERADMFGAHLSGNAPELGLEGIVSKRAGSFYKSGKSRNWLKTINPDFIRT